MKNILGKHYMGYKAVSAQAAFYGLAQALIPGTDFDKNKQKFLKDFKAGESLLYKSHFKPLAEFIAEELLKNSHAKIIQSNCNKALLAMLEHISIDRGFNLNFDTDSGIDGTKLAISIGGLGLLGIFNAWNPMGWLALTAGIIAGLVGIARSIWSFFSSRYQKSQQKKEVDKNLHQICEKIVQDVKIRIESYKKGTLGMIEELNAGFNELVDHYERMKRQLEEAHERLGYISNSIHLTISKQGACNEE
ncbi:hypothetical protein KVD79_02965 [Helicobacter pylori]|nr:hypothetical protein KVD79_02965 [Helicobacter pylori]